MSRSKYWLKTGVQGAAAFGAVGALAFGLATAALSGPVILVASISAGIFGTLGAGVVGLNARRGLFDKRHAGKAFKSGLATAFALSIGLNVGLNYIFSGQDTSKAFNDKATVETAQQEHAEITRDIRDRPTRTRDPAILRSR